jgi:uncharacterized membrane protein
MDAPVKPEGSSPACTHRSAARLATHAGMASTAPARLEGGAFAGEAMGLTILLAGLAVFLGAHVFVTFRSARADLVSRLGEGPYKILFSLVSVLGLVLIVYGYASYRRAGWISVWDPPSWTHYITQLLMWPASIFVVAAYVRGDIWRTLKHPMLVGIKTWALAHLISNGDLGSILLFGSFLAWAVFDRTTLKHRADAGAPPIPVGGRRNDVIAVIVGTLLFLALGLVLHPLAIGIPVFGRPAL